MQTKNNHYERQLQQCRQFFSAGEFGKLNDIFLPLLDKKVPEALLTKVDFLMQQDPNSGISYLLQLAKENIPQANYKMAMLLYFHPELTLDFNNFLLNVTKAKHCIESEWAEYKEKSSSELARSPRS